MLETAIITLIVGLVVFFVYLSASLTRPSRSLLEVPVLVLIVLIIGAGFTLIWGQKEDFPVAVVSGLLIAGSALFGLVFNAALARQDAMRQRWERRDDVMRALAAEIKHYRRALLQFPVDDVIEDMAPRIRQGYVPIVPSENNATVFQAVLPDIHVLPRAVIDPIVQYYSQIKEIEAAIDDLRSDFFRSGTDEGDNTRRLQMYRQYLGVKLRALDYSAAALGALNVDLVKADADIAPATALSNRGDDR